MNHIRSICRSSARHRLSHGTAEPPASQPGAQRADLLATLLGLLDEVVKSLREATTVAENALRMADFFNTPVQPSPA